MSIDPFKDMSREEITQRGEALIRVLGLHVKPHNDRVDTSWGDKTPFGLALTVRRILIEGDPSHRERGLTFGEAFGFDPDNRANEG